MGEAVGSYTRIYLSMEFHVGTGQRNPTIDAGYP